MIGDRIGSTPFGRRFARVGPPLVLVAATLFAVPCAAQGTGQGPPVFVSFAIDDGVLTSPDPALRPPHSTPAVLQNLDVSAVARIYAEKLDSVFPFIHWTSDPGTSTADSLAITLRAIRTKFHVYWTLDYQSGDHRLRTTAALARQLKAKRELCERHWFGPFQASRVPPTVEGVLNDLKRAFTSRFDLGAGPNEHSEYCWGNYREVTAAGDSSSSSESDSFNSSAFHEAMERRVVSNVSLGRATVAEVPPDSLFFPVAPVQSVERRYFVFGEGLSTDLHLDGESRLGVRRGRNDPAGLISVEDGLLVNPNERTGGHFNLGSCTLRKWLKYDAEHRLVKNEELPVDALFRGLGGDPDGVEVVVVHFHQADANGARGSCKFGRGE